MMFRRVTLYLILLLSVCSPVLAGSPLHLSAGVAREDITPDRDLWLGGYFPGRQSAGVHDPIEARALSLQGDNGKIYTIVAVDFIGFLYGDVLRLRQVLGRPKVEVFVLASHTHSAPDTIGLYGPTLFRIPLRSGRDEAYLDWLIRKMARAVEASIADLEPVHILTGSIEFPMLRSKYGGPVDTTLTVTGFKTSASGKDKAIIVNLACHPTTLTRSNMLISADFVGPLRDALDRKLGATSLFVNGALGGVAHVFPHLERNTFEKARQVGEAMAAHAEQAYAGARPASTGGPPEHLRATVTIPLKNKKLLAAALLGIVPRKGISLRHRAVETEVNVLRFGGVTLVMVPGEMHPEPALVIKERFGPGTQVWSLANDEIGYILPADRFHDETLAYWQGVSVGPEAEGVIMEALEEMRPELSAPAP